MIVNVCDIEHSFNISFEERFPQLKSTEKPLAFHISKNSKTVMHNAGEDIKKQIGTHYLWECRRFKFTGGLSGSTYQEPLKMQYI